MFGDDFIVSPITMFSDINNRQIQWNLWIPPGFWMDW
jgi:hypothetical protein